MAIQSKILIVDDDEMNVNILKEILSPNYILEVAFSGDEALNKIPKFNPDLILLDIMMPGTDGYQVCRAIRQDPKFSLVKVILVSGKSMIDERIEGYAAGADDYITKPFHDEELEAKVKVFLRLKRTEEVDNIKNDLLKLFSHETRTPLNGILGIGGILLEDAGITGATRDNIQMMVDCGVQLFEFTEKTNVICTLKSGVSFDKEPGNVLKHLKKVLSDIDEQLQAKDGSISISLSEELIIQCEWGYIERVFSYILNNALKFAGTVPSIKIEHETTELYDIISVSDNGPGVKDVDKLNIFNEFAIKDIMHHKKGQGLSLAIVKYVMESHGGFVEAKDNPDGGAKFLLHFPKFSDNNNE